MPRWGRFRIPPSPPVPHSGTMTTTTITNEPSLRSGAAQLAAATPVSRDRYMDFLRAVSIGVVVLGHWLMAVIIVHGGHLSVDNSIASVRGLWAATWVLQVMPIFFFVGGFANAVALDSLWRRGGDDVEFVTSRARRLLRPVGLLLVIWVPLGALLGRVGIAPTIVHSATRLVTQPLWFIGVYLIVVSLAPWMLRLHRHHGLHVLVVLSVAALATDALRFTLHPEALGYLNVAFVWLFAAQLGFFYADGRLRRGATRVLGAMTGAGFLGLVALTHVGSYPLSMVGLPGQPVSNMSPPTVCILSLTLFQVGLVMLVRDRVAAWLQRPRVWTRVIALNGVIMTVFLWHLSALLLTVSVLYPLGFPQLAAGTPAWWLTRPLWIAILLGALAVFVAVFGQYERPSASPGPVAGARHLRGAGAITVIGVVMTVLGVSGIAVVGIVGLVTSHATLILLDVTPLVSLALLAGGAGLLACVSRGRRGVGLRPATVSAD